jgi:hypothetical protein
MKPQKDIIYLLNVTLGTTIPKRLWQIIPFPLPLISFVSEGRQEVMGLSPAWWDFVIRTIIISKKAYFTSQSNTGFQTIAPKSLAALHLKYFLCTLVWILIRHFFNFHAERGVNKGGGGQLPPHIFGRIEGAARPRRCAALLLAP